MDRKTGFYWVRINDDWEVAKYNSRFNHWEVVGFSAEWYDSDLDEIDEMPIDRIAK